MQDAVRLSRFIAGHPTLTVLTGAGCSAASGIPAYRDDEGEWMHARPVQYADFVASPAVRRRYWARSFAGWQRVRDARPNAAHAAIAGLERLGVARRTITQNVDGLHRDAGSRRVIDLHGRLDRVVCLDCGSTLARERLQRELSALNPGWQVRVSGFAPDGDARLARDAAESFRIADCGHCGGMLKPDVVFFGENVPRARVARCAAAVEASDALLVVGSSLMVFSGFRFARQAAQAGKPLAIVNRGRTRADELASLRISADCADVLSGAFALLQGEA